MTPLTQFILDLMEAPRSALDKMNIEATAKARGLAPDHVKAYRDKELQRR